MNNNLKKNTSSPTTTLFSTHSFETAEYNYVYHKAKTYLHVTLTSYGQLQRSKRCSILHFSKFINSLKSRNFKFYTVRYEKYVI